MRSILSGGGCGFEWVVDWPPPFARRTHCYMTNPYEPRSNSIGRIAIRDSPPPTFRQRSIYAISFSIGCVTGLNLSVALDEGVANAIRRTTIDPIAAVAFFLCVSVVCVSVVGTWKLIRSHLLSKCRTTTSISFASGLTLTFASYLVALYAERSGFDFIGSMFVALVGTTFVVVELEALVMHFHRELSK